ncbi:hypothetical protein FQ085_11755 [Planococcus sp. ANT_H30]|uniref:YopX family protein n=1 Tax=Planococcus sp. ANT_H30 TaxID=2597347 RepID=UPI0011EEA3E4|nr:YopX family protein [Planococcus sp. ANT_H30]KAA0956660.1 hypothetical protein FQ085_11755 [Planococcus sp. ANT_H30]
MREIKFRAWNKAKEILCFDDEDNSAEYMDGINMSDLGFINNRLAAHDDNGYFSSIAFLNNYEVMQYTGLKDKNGVEIYEGDIVQIETYGGRYHRSAIVFEKGSFHMGYLPDGMCEHFEMVVIGNIYQHLHLLSG